ncbi:MAG: thiosulfate oxidation carrier protein SoxY [Gammaproteobacteria bacterium]
MLKTTKRTFLQRSTSLLTFSLFSGMHSVFADWQKELFDHADSDKLISSLTNNAELVDSNAIHIKAPEIAENGAVVPVTVEASINNVKNISILVDNNPSPLTSSYDINPKLEAYVSTRVKMAKSSNIIALVSTTGNKYFTASKSIKVTIGGCGG